VSNSAGLTIRAMVCLSFIILIQLEMSAIFLFAFTTTLQGRTPASTSIRNRPNKVTSVVLIRHCRHSVSCKGSPLQYPAHGLSSPSSPSSVRLHPLKLVSLPSRSSSQGSCIYAFATWSTKTGVSAVRRRQLPALQWILAIVPRGRS